MSDFQSVNGSIKRVLKDAFDIKRYAILFQRLNLLLIGVALLIPLIFYNFFDEDYIKKRSMAFNYEEYIKKQYDIWVSDYNELIEHGVDPNIELAPFHEYYEERLDGKFSRYAFIYLSLVITLLPWLYILFWPVGTPVRVDRKRQLVYTWHWFRLYAARFEQLQPEFPAYAASLERSPGPLIIHLYRAGKTHNKDGSLRKGLKLTLGLYYPQDNMQNTTIYNLIEKFLHEKIEFPDDFKPKKGWLEYSLVPMRKFPDDKRLNKALDEWWDKEQYPRSCPSIEWMVDYVNELEREGKLLAKPTEIPKQGVVPGRMQNRLSRDNA